MSFTCWQNKREHTKKVSQHVRKGSSHLPSTGLTSAGACSSCPPMLFSLMLSISRQKSSMEALSIEALSTEACELERLNAGECRDSLESILLILRQRGMDFLRKEYLWIKSSLFYVINHKIQFRFKVSEEMRLVWKRGVRGENLHSVVAFFFLNLL